MNETRVSWPQVFFDWFGGAASEGRAAGSPLAKAYASPGFETVRRLLMQQPADRPERLAHTYFRSPKPVDLVIETVEALWAPIAERDDWSPFYQHMTGIENARQALA